MTQPFTEYLVVSRSNATTKNGSPYCLLKLRSLVDDLSIAVWDVAATAPPVVGQTVSFKLIQDKGDGKKSANGLDMIPGRMPQEGDPLYDLIPRPIPRAQWDACIQQLLAFCTDPLLAGIIRDMADTLFGPYAKYPAATSVHHAYKGGLLNHVYQMLHMLEGIYSCLPYSIKIERCILGILFHDYGKVYEYSPEGETQPDMYLVGHIYISANRLQKILMEKQVDGDEINKILHVVLSHHGELEYGSPVVPCTKEAVLVTHIDNISAKMDNIDSTPNLERSFALGTHVVKD